MVVAPDQGSRGGLATDPRDRDLALLRTRVDALGAALEHVLDLLEAFAENQELVDWHVQRAREELGRTR